MKRPVLFSLTLSFWIIFVVVFMITSVKEAKAIPAFARKYQTSCATCHTAIPKLTAFGESFRRNGFQFPEGTDMEYIKEPPVSLGAEGNKRAFPDAIWPSTIPGTSPISVITESEFTYSKDADPKIDFTSFPAELDVVAGGTFGESIGFYSEVELSEEGVGVERVYVSLLNMFGPRSLVNLKIGQFEPGVFYFSNHRRLGEKYLIETFTVGDNEWSLEPTQQGFELYGLTSQGRLGYNAGLVEGRGNIVNTAKDVYGHLTYKFGGLRLDGVAPEGQQPFEKSQPWVDNSVIVGGFVYSGKSELAPDSGATLNDPFRAFGGDVQIFYNRLNLFGALAVFDHDHPFLEKPTTSGKATVTFGEAQVIVYPWLIPWARFENASFEGVNSRKFYPGVTALMRANVRVQFFGEFVKDGTESFEFEGLEGGLVYGF
jgi:hypothetical protein